MVTKYAQERLEALYARVDDLERAIEVAGAFLERAGDDRDLMKIYGRLALTTLLTVIREDFKSALLCDADTTDEQLDDWLQVIAEEAAREPTP